MSGFFEEVHNVLASGERIAMASITIQKGSSPRSSGTRFAVRENGEIIGTIGGGLLEARTRDAGVKALRENRRQYLDFNLTNDEIAASGMVCGGSLQVMVNVWGENALEVSGHLAGMERTYTRGVLVSRWDDEKGMLVMEVFEDAGPAQTSGDEVLSRLIENARRHDRTALEIEGAKGVVVERIEPKSLPLIVFGGGHIGMALGAIAPHAGFDVTIVDDRKEITEKTPPPAVKRVVHASVEEFFAENEPNKQTFVVICSPGHQSDARCAVASLKREVAYVGMIGSRRKSRIVTEHLRQSGVTEEELRVLHTPTGLPIGAETPGEIAVSILAEMIAIRHQGNKRVR